MKYSFNFGQALIIKCILMLLLLNPVNTVDAKTGSHSIEEVSTQDIRIKKRPFFKKIKAQTKRKKKDYSYGERSYRMSLWVLGCVGLSIITGGLGLIGAIVCGIISVRHGLRSLKEKEEGISREKRNKGILISLISLVVIVLGIGLLLVILSTLL